MPDSTLVARLQSALGVTRLARITELDRLGIEACSAIRPGGHVLQVCNGKGLSIEAAELSALGETAELVSAETMSAAPFAIASALELRRRADAPRGWSLAECCGSAGWLVAPELAKDDVRCAWTEGEDVLQDERIVVPSQVLFCPPTAAIDLGPIAVAWASNGTGAHVDPDAALLHALLEACERELLVRALPDGWTSEVLLSRRLTLRSIEKLAPELAALLERVQAADFDVALFDLTPRESFGLPLAGALLVDREGGPVPIAAGYACRTIPADALMAAFLEAAQSRLTDIHGAREDVAPMHAQDVAVLRGTLASAGATRDAAKLPALRRGSDSKAVLAALSRGGVENVGVFDITAPELPIRVIRVVVPGFRISELLV